MSLTQLSYYLRKIFPYVIIAFLSILVVFYLVRFLIFYIQSRQTHILLNPIFGTIPKFEVPEASSSAGLTYRLDTINGQPATATTAANLYFLPPTTAHLGYRQKIYLMARQMGFDITSLKNTLKGTTASFKDGPQSLDIDIANFNFIYTYDFKEDESILAGAVAPEEKGATDKAVEFLQSIDKYPTELSQGLTHAIYTFYNTDDKTIAFVDEQNASQLTPNLIEIDFYRPDIDSLPIVPPSYFNSQNFVLLSRTQGASYRVLRGQVKYFDRSAEQVGAYPLKTGAKAYEELKAGGGFVVGRDTAGKKTITIKKEFLAYYDPATYEPYLRPIFVFLGTNNFVAYVDAVSPEYVVK